MHGRKRERHYTRQHNDGDDVAAVRAVLASDWLTTGPKIEEFENCVASYCGASYGVAVSSATAGLHAVLHGLGVGKNDRVWTSPNSFVASANCALYCGAEIDFVDIDLRSGCMGAAALEKKLALAAHEGTLPKAIVAVHFGGLPCDLEAIANAARAHGVAVVEDASHALGATYHGAPIGSCNFSDAAVFSFQATKSIATGEGGMVATNRRDIAGSVRLFRAHGITRDPSMMTRTGVLEPWRYEQTELGFNYLMTDIQAALGVSQMSKLDAFVERRSELAARYDSSLENLAVQTPYRAPDRRSAWHLYSIRLLGADPQALRRELYDGLALRGIKSQVHYIPIHTQPFFQTLGFRVGDFPESERHYSGELSLPLFVDLDDADQDRVIDVVREIVPARP